MKKIIVFGATGTVGAYTSLYLVERDYEVIAVGHRASDNVFFADYGMQYISVDISKKEEFDKLPLNDVYGIINLSGILPARMKGYEPQRYIDVNMTGSLNVLEYAVKCNVKKVLFTQSISDVSYLCGSKTPIEADALSKFPIDNDHSVYSITKTASCNMLIHYATHYNFKYYILRFPNIYLYHPNPYYYVDGELKWQGYRLMINKAIKGEPLQIWGNPDKVRDIVYVKDCSQIIERAMAVEDAECGYYNVGTGVGTRMEDQVKGIVDVFSSADKKSVITFAPDKPDAVEYIFDISKTVKNLGYTPKYDYKAYLEDLKKEMESQRFKKLWGEPVE